MNYKRVNKPTARKMFNHGCDIMLLPCKVSDSVVIRVLHDYDWIKPITINIDRCEHSDNKFDRSVADYEFYNCNAELGYYAHYFVSIEDTIKCKFV